MLHRVYILTEEIAAFLENKDLNAIEFPNQQWVSNLAFLFDSTSHLTTLISSFRERSN